MALLDIICTDNPILRRPAKKIKQITPEISRLIDDMVETMRAAPGVGLAAPQVAKSLRLFVAEIEEDADMPGSGKLYVVINPDYLFKSAETVAGNEGCLSVPGYAGEVDRHASVVVKGLDRHGRKIKLKVEGWLARVFQHEIDHLDGVLFIDRIDDPEKIWQIEVGTEEQVETPDRQA